MVHPILEQVSLRMNSEGLTLHDAAIKIGVGATALARHLSGEYVRSDSLAKYRLWLDGARYPLAPSQQISEVSPLNLVSDKEVSFPEEVRLRNVIKGRAHYVVDLFCGCGGMSLGFERFEGNQKFKLAMALDIEEPMVRVFNDNHPNPHGEIPIARRSDISDFMNETEIQLFYLDHLARSTRNSLLRTQLNQLGSWGISAFRSALHEIDKSFLSQLQIIRGSEDYRMLLKGLGSALGQTSVIGFHSITKLPNTGSGEPKLGPIIWHDDGAVDETRSETAVRLDTKLMQSCRRNAKKLWNSEIEKLQSRASGQGQGQLASAAERIQRFVEFTQSHSMQKVRDIWVDWRSTRDAIRITFLDNQIVKTRVQEVYNNGHQVSVLLGGPPCQGFSRIGRGKIRSLREQSVHVQEDENSVDSRNQLMHQYVLFVAALSPSVFLFENVRHFQAIVKSDGIEFDAADILAESIKAVSETGLNYEVGRRIIVGPRHAIPQTRERFVMAGVRADHGEDQSTAADWCLALTQREPVSLKVALEGLPAPTLGATLDGKQPAVVQATPPVDQASAANFYRRWVLRSQITDAHIGRAHRGDDRAFFALMGPGKRWMDYRCDDTTTLNRLSHTLNSIKKALDDSPKLAAKIGVSQSEINELANLTDGSLSLRLLLEMIAPQAGEEEHHLLAGTYLKKREGAHGDWLARMDPSLPSKTVVSHMAKDTYAFVHPFEARTLSVREAARIQTFPDDYKFGSVGMADGFKVVGNAVPPLLSWQFAERVAKLLDRAPKVHFQSQEAMA